jgi:lysophospholipase L1-like esterase
MRRFPGRALALAAATLLTMTACSAEPAEQPGDQIIIVGDSYTTGPKDDAKDQDLWPAMVWKDLRAQGYEAPPTVSGEGGAGYAKPGYRGGTFADKARVIKASTQLVVFFGSANDMEVPPEVLTGAVRETLTTARTTAPKAHLLVIGPAWPRPDPPAEVLRVRDIVRDGAAAIGAPFVDPLEQHWLWQDPRLIGPDGIHPDRAGQEFLAEKILPLVEAQLPPTR